VIDYRTGDLAGLLREQVGPVDVVLDTVGAGAAEASLDVLRPGGVLVTIVRHSDAALRESVEAAGRRFAGVAVEPDGPALAGLAALVEAGALRVHVERTFALEEVGEAHRLLDAGGRRGSGAGITGKLVLVP
jgi:NADPH:quinone reductase-like Zn-dependent oxidoreductase